MKPGTLDQWVVIAQKVLAGRYAKADRSTKQSIIIGLRSLDHPDCIAAAKKLGHQPF